MFKKILTGIILLEMIITGHCILQRPEKIEQPETFYQLENYQLAKYSRWTYGGICYKYANRMLKLYPSTRKEHVIIRYRGFDTLTHYRGILFENDDFTVYTDSNAKGNGIIRTWYDFK